MTQRSYVVIARFADSYDVGVESQSAVDDHTQRLDHRWDR